MIKPETVKDQDRFPAYFVNAISQQNFRTLFREFIKHTFQFIIEAVLRIINSIFCWGMNVQNNDMTPATS
jgi:hypothetical protein